MSVNTKAKFLGKLDAEALLGFIKENIDPNVESTIETKERKVASKFHDEIIFLGKRMVLKIGQVVLFTLLTMMKFVHCITFIMILFG